nr:hypothetical protein [Tanacetum cinerariifolium]
MASTNSSRAVAVCALDELVVISSKTKLFNYMRFFFLQKVVEAKTFAKMLRDNARDYIDKLHVMVCEMEAMDDSFVGFDILDFLKESKELENNKFKALLDLIAQTEEAICLKEGHIVKVLMDDMAVPLGAIAMMFPRAVAVCALDELVVISSKTKLFNYMRFFFLQKVVEAKTFAKMLRDNARDYIDKLHVMVCEMEAMDDSFVGFDILDFLKESKELENNKFKALLDLIAQTEEAICLKEGHVDLMDLEIDY